MAQFWLTNLTNRNISLADLNLTIKSFSSINLLDSKHYYYTLEQLVNSAKNGSIYRKSNKLAVRETGPKVIKTSMQVAENSYLPTRGKSLLVISEEEYEELNISDEDFAKDSVEGQS